VRIVGIGWNYIGLTQKMSQGDILPKQQNPSYQNWSSLPNEGKNYRGLAQKERKIERKKENRKIPARKAS